MQVQHHCELALSREKAHKESPDKLMQGVLELFEWVGECLAPLWVFC